MKNKTKLISGLLISSILFTSCSKNYYSNVTTASSQVNQLQAEKSNSLDSWKLLVTSDNKNIALAEILSKSIVSDNKKEILEMVEKLTPQEIDEIIKQVNAENEALSKLYMFRGNTSQANSKVYNLSIEAQEKDKLELDKNQVTLTTVNYLKSKSLDEIHAQLSKMIDEGSTEAAHTIAVDLSKGDPDLLKEISSDASQSSDKLEFIEKLKKNEKYVKYVEKYFVEGKFNTRDEMIFVGTATVGAVLYLEFKDNKDLLATIEKLKVKYTELKPSIDKIQAAVSSLKKYRSEISEASKGFNEGIGGIKEAYKSGVNYIESNNKTAEGKSKNEEVVKYLHDKAFGNKIDENKIVDPKIKEIESKFKTSILQTSNSSAKIADSFSNIISTTTALCDSLGVKIPKDLQKVLSTASKVAQGVKLASTLISGALSGGIMPALSLISSGPVASLLGGGQPDPAIMEALGKIDAKLDQVLENQKKMMEIQIETIKMIKNLAVMIDEYHQQTMLALANLRDYQLVSLEIQRSDLNSNIRKCEDMINFQLKSEWNAKYKRIAWNGMLSLDLDYSKFYDSLDSMAAFRRLAYSSAEKNYSDCQSSLAEVFGVSENSENKLLSIYNTSDVDNLKRFNDVKFQPLKDYFLSWTSDDGVKLINLHLPIYKLSDIDSKKDNLLNGENSSASDFDFNLDNLISVKSLERYLSSLLILYPVMEYDKSDWNLSPQEIISTYFKNSNLKLENSESNLLVSRSYYFLNNALDLVHSAIAQEALLAGESVIPKIREDFKEDLLSSTNLDELSKAYGTKLSQGDFKLLMTSIRSNELLMKNFLRFTIQKNVTFVTTLDKYEQALASEDKSFLTSFLTGKSDSGKLDLIKENGKWKISLPIEDEKAKSISFALPTRSEVEHNKVIYSENMGRLLTMQSGVIKAMTKVSPTQYRSKEEREKYSTILLMNKL